MCPAASLQGDAKVAEWRIRLTILHPSFVLKGTPIEAIGRVTHGDRAGAGCFESAVAVLVAQPEDALGAAQMVDGVIDHEPGDDCLAGGSDVGGDTSAPGWGAHVERDLLRRVVGEIGGASAGATDMGGDHLGAGEDLHYVSGGADMKTLPDQPPRQRIESFADFVVADQPGRHSFEVFECCDMASAPTCLVHPKHWAHEQVS